MRRRENLLKTARTSEFASLAPNARNATHRESVARKIMIKRDIIHFSPRIKSLLQISEHGGCGEDTSQVQNVTRDLYLFRYF